MRLLPPLAALLFAATLSAQQVTLPLWPNGTPQPSKITGPEYDPTTPADKNVGGIQTVRVTNVSRPTLTMIPPAGHANGTAIVVLPGGGYRRLAFNEEGTEICAWVNSLGATCVLVKYRVPEDGRFPENPADMEDAQQAMRLTREHAAEWHVDPRRVGVIGFSAGGHLAAVLSAHPDFQGAAPASAVSARPDFQILVYPAYINDVDGRIDRSVKPGASVPATLLIMAEDDNTAHIEGALSYYQALKDAGVPADMRLYARGGHGFGMRPTGLPEAQWPAMAAGWLQSIGMAPR